MQNVRADSWARARGGENLYENPDYANHHGYALPLNATRLRVTLTAENMNEQQFQFRLVRQSDGRMDTLEPINF
jgi:hypothetical protein